MIPQPTDFFALHAQDHSRREAVATAERLRDSGGFRVRTASLLRGLADHLSPLPAPPRAASVPAVTSLRSARSRCHSAA
jgi:hypothetical protein